jgi:hypothetical protein
MGYFGPLYIKEISGVKIGTLLWIDKEDLKWAPGQKMAALKLYHLARYLSNVDRCQMKPLSLRHIVIYV